VVEPHATKELAKRQRGHYERRMPTHGMAARMCEARSLLAALLSLLAAWDGIAQQTTPPATMTELQQRLTQVVSQPKYASALWGIKIVSLDSGKTVFEHNSQKLFSPASNSKLYTVALALERLGPEFRIRTSVYAAAKPNPEGVLEGDLILYGRGDPTLNARLHEGDVLKALEPLVSGLTNAGVRRIAGDLVADQSFFRGPEFGSGWAWDDMENYYGAEISALTINDNTVQMAVKPAAQPRQPCELILSPPTTYLVISNRTETVEKGLRRVLAVYRPLNENIVYVSGQVPVDDPGRNEDVTMHNPAGFFAILFKQALARYGIEVDGRLRTVNWLDRQSERLNCDELVELAHMESPPLSDIAREVQKPSQNLYADLLLAQVGERVRSSSSRREPTSEMLGIEELNKLMGELGIARGDVLFEEGSGLSRNNLTTPRATIRLLQYMAGRKCAAAYTNALPIAGVDGTLRNRMKGTPAAGNVRAKTGTLRWANSLSGYVTTAAGEHWAFCLMLNRYQDVGAASSARAEIDGIAAMLAGFEAKSD
jgi:serine-type D-Ala-D-Ala carboxypeptidase/endopeptidase (penicillin-binding protein 4)